MPKIRQKFNWPRGYKPYEMAGLVHVETRKFECEMMGQTKVRHVLLLTSRGTLARAGDTWKTEAGACRAAWRHFACELGGDQICAAGYPLGQLHRHDGLPCAHWPEPRRRPK